MSHKVSIAIIYKNNENTIKACIESILNQKFKDYEIICINNASKDNSEQIVNEIAQEQEKIKLISLPEGMEEQKAREYAVSIANGEFICFLNPNEVIYETFTGGFKLELFNCADKNLEIEYGKIYKRELLENSELLGVLIDKQLSLHCANLSNTVKECENFVKEKIDISEKNTINTINDKVFDMSSRFNQLEKTLFDKTSMLNNAIEGVIKDTALRQEALKGTIYSDISKVYDYINAEINKKGCELNKVYDEINTNYKYTESLSEKSKEELQQNIKNEVNNFVPRLETLENEIVVRYSNLKNLLEAETEQINKKLSQHFEEEKAILNERLNEIREEFKNQLQDLREQINK